MLLEFPLVLLVLSYPRWRWQKIFEFNVTKIIYGLWIALVCDANVLTAIQRLVVVAILLMFVWAILDFNGVFNRERLE